ncbi:hypothetical protein MNBD_NITROSPINAE02-1821 [hydrothermal vent metagenome]|uniref:Band 7 domain-containing protein n=1 Tax=hydrothermal vent metagenome TaxID=652676 RepID=A0A3B1CSW3_9ZZZZ
METVFLALVFAGAAIFLPGKIPDHYKISDKHVSQAGEEISIAFIRMPLRILLSFMALVLAAHTSYVIIDADKIGLLNKVYGGKSLSQGRIIATNGETGPQAEIMGPGLNIKPLLNVIYEVESRPVHEVPLDSYGLITAKDGLPLKDGQNFADKWKPGLINDMMKAEYFLGEGKGQKGPQATVLKPGKYRYNPFLFEIENRPARKIAPGRVGVVKSAVQELPVSECKSVELPKDIAFSVSLVPKGCRGIWSSVLGPGTYYLNENAYKITPISSRVQKWSYVGGYTKRRILLSIKQNGRIDQKIESERVSIPAHAAGGAIILKVEGWEIPLELRAIVQVDPKNAPVIFAAIGSLEQMEEKLFTPLVRSVVKNITTEILGTNGKNKTNAGESRVLSLRDKRDLLEARALKEIKTEAASIGLKTLEIRFSNPVIPPELLVAPKREQLAEQMQQTFIQEQAAQKKRIEVEKAIAEADLQKLLMKAEIEKKAAEHLMEAKRLEGEGEKLKLQEIAKGQSAQVAVLGKEKTMQLAVIDKLLEAAVTNPDIVKVPRISVQNGAGGGSLEGAFAILGDSSLTKGMDVDETMKN